MLNIMLWTALISLGHHKQCKLAGIGSLDYERWKCDKKLAKHKESSHVFRKNVKQAQRMTEITLNLKLQTAAVSLA